MLEAFSGFECTHHPHYEKFLYSKWTTGIFCGGYRQCLPLEFDKLGLCCWCNVRSCASPEKSLRYNTGWQCTMQTTQLCVHEIDLHMCLWEIWILSNDVLSFRYLIKTMKEMHMLTHLGKELCFKLAVVSTFSFSWHQRCHISGFFRKSGFLKFSEKFRI